MTTQSTLWLASRELCDPAALDEVYLARVGMPQKLSAQRWRCAFQLSGPVPTEPEHAHGIDAMQALVNALAGLNRLVKGSGRALTWLGGDPGDSGLYRQVPTHLGSQFACQIEALIDQAVTQKEAELQRLTELQLGLPRMP